MTVNGIGALWDNLIRTMSEDIQEYELALQEVRRPTDKEQYLQEVLNETPPDQQGPILEALCEIERERLKAIRIINDQVSQLKKTSQALKVMAYTGRGTRGIKNLS